MDTARLRAAYLTARDALLAERVPAGHWVGELSTSALSTATAVTALHLVNPFEHRDRIDAGLRWLADHQNADGGWGDTTKSVSNISTTMLCRAAFDSLTDAQVWGDDVQVVEVTARKVYPGEGIDALDQPGMVLHVWPLPAAEVPW